MSTGTLRIGGCILLGLLAHASSPGSDTSLPPCPPGLIEGPDPIGRTCEPRDKEKTGTSTLRGCPETGHDPATGAPFMVWEEGDDGLRDIAFRMWSDGDWSGTEFLASSSADERDPRAFAAEDGTILVSWWAEGRDAGVYYARREPVVGSWSPGVRVADDGARPSIAAVSGRALIVFERSRPNGGVDLVAVTEGLDGGFAERLVLANAGFGSLASRVRHERGRTWVEWMPAPLRLAWSAWVDGRWSAAQTVGVAVHSWQAEQSARERVREIVLED